MKQTVRLLCMWLMTMLLANATGYGQTLAVGDTFQGGKIGYILQPGDPGYDATKIKGFVVGTTDYGGQAWAIGGYASSSTGVSSTAIGSGPSNTTQLVTLMGPGNYYAYTFDTLTLGGYTDWYLPSQGELTKTATFNDQSAAVLLDFSWDYATSSEAGGIPNTKICYFGETFTFCAEYDKTSTLGRARPFRNFEVSLCTSSSSFTSIVSCSNYTWNGNTYTTSGTYTWTGTNAGGCDSIATLSLTITKLVTPTNLVATPINNGGMIQFTVPFGSGTDKDYEYSIDNGANWLRPDTAVGASPLIIRSGLTNCNSYEVKIREVNSCGTSEASAAVTLTPAAANDPGIDWIPNGSLIDRTWNSVTYGNGTFVAVASGPNADRVATSPDGLNWSAHAVTNYGDFRQWKDVVYGNGLFVAVAQSSGVGNRVMTSPDGINWTSRSSAEDNNWQSVTYGNGLFVAVSGNGTNKVMTSSDGINWTPRVAASNNSWRSVTYGNGLFVAVCYYSGTGDRVMTSPDGITWTSRVSAADYDWAGVTYGNGLFVAVTRTSSQNGVMTSPDGINWTLRTAPGNNWEDITYGNGVFAAVAFASSAKDIMTSADGITWTLRDTKAENESYAIAFGNGVFVTVASYSGTDNLVMTSSFSPATNAPVINSTSVINDTISVNFTQSAPILASGAKQYEYSTDNGANWTALPVDSIASPLKIGGLTPGISYPFKLRSKNLGGTSCESAALNVCIPVRSSDTANAVCSYNWNGHTYTESGVYTDTLVGMSGCDSIVTLHLTLTEAATKPANLVATPINNGGMIQFAVPLGSGNYTNYEYSIDNGANWISPDTIIMQSPAIIRGLTNCTEYLVKLRAVTSCGTSDETASVVLIPTNANEPGVDWITRPTQTGTGWTSVAYGNGMYVAVGYLGSGNRVMSSPDGINWTSRSSAADNSWTSVTYGDGLFVAVSNDGVGNRVMTSPDGVNWTSRVSAADNSWMSVVYGDGLFVAVSSDGTGNRVMTSPDGINWTSRTSATDNMWYSVTHGNGLFVAVSYDGNGDRVMTSPDGIDWTLGISAADNYWYSVTYGNGLFVAISYDGTDKDVMTSPDGFEWTLQNNESGHSFISITYGNGLFAAAAYDASGNDIMTSPDGINWTIQRTDAANALSGIAYGNGLFVGITSGGPVMTSSYSPAAYAPSIDSVSIKLDSAMVHFNQTLPLMASAVTNYEYSIDNGSNWIARSPASASSPIALGGLNPRSTYPVKIRAINNAGASCETSAVQIRLCTQTTTSTTTVTSRGLFGWNGKDYTATGTYKDSLVNAAGCDSIATLNLTIIPAITNETVRIGNQTWTTNNLAISHYKNGDLIPQVTDRAVWDTLTTGAWCWYNNDSVNYAKYGKLYNWYAVNDPRGFGLPNFRMPTALDYDTLRQTTDKLTEFSQPGINVWNQDVRATNISGFGAYPLGLRNGEPGGSTDFNPNGESVDKWTSTVYPFSADSAIQVQLSFDSVADSLQYNALIASKRMGLPVRLLGCNPTTSTTTVTSRGLYGWNGVDYTATGTYQKVLVNATGCDSIATLNLTILPAITTDTVRIGTQTWTTKNLDVVRYRNGDLIPQVTDSASWRNLTTGAWAWYNNDSVNYAHYGRLYNWYAVNDSRGLAPRGYHVPTGNEALILQYNFPTDGNALIAPGINIWDEPTSPGTNISGFSMIPAGARYGTSGSGPTDFGELKKMGAFWLADDYERSSPAILFQYQANDTADAFVGTGALFGKMFGFPVRLIKDPCSPTSSDTTVSACFSFSWNGQTLTSSGIYKDTLTNIGGCDSIATLNLTITPKPTWYKDADADGYGVGDSLIVCDQPTGYRLLKDMIAATGDCDDTNANIRPNSSTAATSILASSTAVTAGGNVTLTVNGGSLGASDSWKWYSGSCGGTAIGSGTSIVVSPSVTTTYYLRAEGCTNTSCVSVTITACGPTGVTASAANNTICAGTSTTLTVQGVLSGAASWKWYKNACGSEDSRSSNEGPIGSGSTLKVSPTATTTYYVRSEGGVCGKTICKSITITVNPKPAKPASVSVPSKICKQSTIQLTVGEVKSATSYKWTVPAGWSIVSGQGTRTVRIKVGKASANVNVAAVNSCGTSANYAKMITVGNCTSTSSAVLVTTAMKPVADEMVDVAASLQIQAYPNPSTNQFTVRNNNSYVIQLRMVHITGQVVDAFSQVQPGASVQFGAAYRPGIYLVEATGNGLKTTQKLIKQ